MPSLSRARVFIAVGISAAVIAAVLVATRLPTMLSPTANGPPPQRSQCPRSVGLCVERTVTRVLDGDTLDIEGGFRIRLVLVDAPELRAPGGPEARDYLTNLCLGSRALVDEDDFQIGDDPYRRVLGVVYCRGTNANAAMISSGHARTFYDFCSQSEFGTQAWTGCAEAPPAKCDPAYPDVCIPPPPPDLDCADIPYRNFRVLPPDPHHFDTDGDGIGCEGP